MENARLVHLGSTDLRFLPGCCPVVVSGAMRTHHRAWHTRSGWSFKTNTRAEWGGGRSKTTGSRCLKGQLQELLPKAGFYLWLNSVPFNRWGPFVFCQRPSCYLESCWIGFIYFFYHVSSVSSVTISTQYCVLGNCSNGIYREVRHFPNRVQIWDWMAGMCPLFVVLGCGATRAPLCLPAMTWEPWRPLQSVQMASRPWPGNPLPACLEPGIIACYWRFDRNAVRKMRQGHTVRW